MAPAKLNLFLHINARRQNGYHELQTCFQLLDYGDQLDFEINESGSISLESSLASLSNSFNLVHRAAVLLQAKSGHSLGATIRLRKQLPLGAGLGGGSSDAATTLLALNNLWDCGLSKHELAALGLRLGADVPVFIHGHSSWAEGLGEILQPLELPERWYLVITPACEVPTAEIFSHQQLTRNTATIKISPFPFSGTRNDCEAVAVALYPEIGAALDWLGYYAPARMTGTGSSVFADFSGRAAAESVFRKLPDTMRGFVARGINKSPVLQALEEI